MGDTLTIIIVFIVLLPFATLLTAWMHGFPILQWMGLRKPRSTASGTSKAEDSSSAERIETIKSAIRSKAVAIQNKET